MLDENGEDEVTRVIEDARENPGNSIFGRAFGFYARHCIIVRYDAKLLAAELAISAATIVLCIVIYLLMTAKIVADPSASAKSTFLLCQGIAIIGTAVILTVYNIVVKTKEVLIVMLKILAIISIAVLITLIVYKISMDNSYTIEFYRDYFKTEAYKYYSDGEEKTVGIGISGIRYTTIQENYVQKCKDAYFKFTLRACILFVAQVAEIVLILYIISKLQKIEKIKDDTEKDDKILFDDEINCRY